MLFDILALKELYSSCCNVIVRNMFCYSGSGRHRQPLCITETLKWWDTNLPLLPRSVREDSEDLFVQQRHLLEPRQLLSEFYLQTVASTVLPFQMLDRADASDRKKTRALSDPHICSSRKYPSKTASTNLSWPDTMMATRSHTASASSM